jgi:hypothetical protein
MCKHVWWSLGIVLFAVSPGRSADAPGIWRSDPLLTAAAPTVRQSIAYVQVTTDGKGANPKDKTLVRQGTAVLVAKRKAEDGKVVGEFVTCYHVIAGATDISLYGLSSNKDEAEFKVIQPEGAIQFHARPSRDLALLRLPLNDPDRWAPVPLLPDDPPLGNTALLAGFGFPEYARRSLRGVKLRAGGLVNAKQYLDDAAQLAPEERLWNVLQANREHLASGLSGGPLLARSEKESKEFFLAGLMFASDARGAELAVPAAEIRDLLAAGKTVHWKQTGAGLEWDPVPFVEYIKKQFGAAGGLSDVSWSGLEGWEKALRDPLGFRERFQELALDLPAPVVGERVVLRVTEGCLGGGGKAEVWINGHRHAFPAPKAPKPLEWDITECLAATGDSLIVVRKVTPPKAGADLNITDVLSRTNDLALTLQWGDAAPYTISRAVPAVIENYSVYITARRPAGADSQLQPDEQFRLAVRVDAVQRFFNEIPFSIPIEEILKAPDGKPIGRVEANLVFAPDDREAAVDGREKWRAREFVKIRPTSGQTADITVRGRVEGLSASIPGVGLKFDNESKGMGFEFRNRLHFAREPGAEPDTKPGARVRPFHTTLRATGAAAVDEIQLPILNGGGFRLNADVSSIVCELGLQWVNNRHLKPETPLAISTANLAQLLTSAGGTGRGLTEKVIVRRAVMRDIGGQTWLIVTLGLPNVKSESAAPPPFLPPSGEADRVVDLVARDVPAALALELASLGRGTRPADPNGGRLKELHLTFAPPPKWLTTPPPDRKPVAARGSALAGEYAKLWASLFKEGKTTLAVKMTDHDLLRTIGSIEPGVTWTPKKQETELLLSGDSAAFGLADGQKLGIEQVTAPAQKLAATGVAVSAFRIAWGADGRPAVTVGVTAEKVAIGPTAELTGVSFALELSPGKTPGATNLVVGRPKFGVKFPGVEFDVAEDKEKKEAWQAQILPGGRLEGRFGVTLDNGAGRVEVVLDPGKPAAGTTPEVPPRAYLAAAEVNLAKVKGIPEKLNEAVRKATGQKWGMEVKELWFRSVKDELELKSSVHMKVIVNVPVLGRQEKEFKTDLNARLTNLLKPLPGNKLTATVAGIGFEVPAEAILGGLDLPKLFGENLAR